MSVILRKINKVGDKVCQKNVKKKRASEKKKKASPISQLKKRYSMRREYDGKKRKWAVHAKIKDKEV